MGNGPYYVIKDQSRICDAIGGININEQIEALDREDNPIPGFYAGGSTSRC